jgi:threonine 3-dehydrogenase
MGASRAINVGEQDIESTMKDLGMTEGFDVGLEMSGNGQAFRDLLASMNHGGRVAILGIPPTEVPIEWNQVIFKGLILKGIYGREMFETWYKMTAMLQSGLNVTPVLTHHFPVDAYEPAFEIMRSGESGKVVLDWQ